MSQHFLQWIQRGSTAEIADAVAEDPALAGWRDAQGISALMWSIYHGQTMVRDFLLLALDKTSHPLDIFEAAAVGDPSALAIAISAGAASVNDYSGDGWTPLHLAAAFGTADAVALLLVNGAKVDAVSSNPQHNQPLHAAVALTRDPESIRLLLEAGVDPNATQTAGFTAIFSVAAANRLDLAELLVSFGANPALRNDFGKSAGDLARERGYHELADWLDRGKEEAPEP